MLNPSFIQIGTRILNINAIRFVNIENPKLIDVYINEEDLPFQFADADADAFMAAIGA